MKNSQSNRIKKNATIALFVAIAYLMQFVLRINVAFLSFDIMDAVLTIGAMVFGPLSAVVMALLVAVLEFASISDTGIWGLIMNFCGTATFTITASLIYKYRKTLGGAIVALTASIVSMTVVMLACNLVITPLYTGSSVSDVAKMIPTLLLPFNLSKAILNAGLVLLLYKPVTAALRGVKLIPSGQKSYRFDRNTVIMLAIALVFLALSITLLVVLGGALSWF